MIPKYITDITLDDINALVENCIYEHKQLDYKQSLKVDTDRDKKEFLKDICAFANSSGGDLVIGIHEEKGKPVLLGNQIENYDQLTLQLEQIITSCIKPTIVPHIQFSPSIEIEPNSNKFVYVIRVKKSLNSPHQVTFQKWNKFFIRFDKSSKPIEDVEDLRMAFNLSENISERLQQIRIERIGKILSNEAPVEMKEGPKVVLHLIPLTALHSGKFYDVNSLYDKITPLRTPNSYGYRFNFDGVLCASNFTKATSYVQAFNTGMIETVLSFGINKEHPTIPYSYEKMVLDKVNQYLNNQKTLNIDCPIFVFLSLLNVKKLKLSCPTNHYDIEHLFDRDHLLIPPCRVDSYDNKVDTLLQPAFDRVWNACGVYKALTYDKTGNRKGL